MKYILFLGLITQLNTFLLGQNCSIKFVIKDSEDGKLLADANIFEDGSIIKISSFNGEALLIGRNCNRTKFKVSKDGFQSLIFFTEATDPTQEKIIKLVNLKRLQESIFEMLKKTDINYKQVKKMDEILTNAYKDNDTPEILTSYKNELETTVVKLKSDGMITNKQIKDLLKE
jgi:hypothetical protein